MPKVVWVLAAGRVVTSASSFTMLFLTLYLTSRRGLTLGEAGLISGGVGVGLMLGNFTGGRWGDRRGHRRVLLEASTLCGIGLVAVPWLPVPELAVVLCLVGYLGATAGTSQGALAALAVPAGERRTAVAISRAASNGGFVIGPPLGALVATVSFDALFVMEGAMMLVVRVTISRMLPPETGKVGGTVAPTGAGLWGSVRTNRSLAFLMPAIVMVDIVYRQLYTTLPVFLREHGQPIGLYAAMIATGSALILLLEIPVAVRLRRLPALPILATGYALVGIGFGVLVLVPLGLGVARAAVVSILVLTTGEILYKTTATADVLDAAPVHLLGQFQGLYTGLSTSGTLLAAPLGAWLYAVAPDALWPTCVLLCLLAAALALRSGRNRPDCSAGPRTTPELGGTSAPRPGPSLTPAESNIRRIWYVEPSTPMMAAAAKVGKSLTA